MYLANLGKAKRVISACFWLILNYFHFSSLLKNKHGAKDIIPYKISSWHNGACYFKGNFNGVSIFIKTDFYFNLLYNEYAAYKILSGDESMSSHFAKIVFFDSECCQYIAHEFINGFSLEKFIIRKATKKTDFLLIVDQIIDILDFFYLKKIIHRDMKSDNFFIDNEMRVVVIDFLFAIQMGDKENFKELVINSKNRSIISHMGLSSQVFPFIWDDVYGCFSMINEFVDVLSPEEKIILFQKLCSRFGRLTYALGVDIR